MENRLPISLSFNGFPNFTFLQSENFERLQDFIGPYLHPTFRPYAIIHDEYYLLLEGNKINLRNQFGFSVQLKDVHSGCIMPVDAKGEVKVQLGGKYELIPNLPFQLYKGIGEMDMKKHLNPLIVSWFDIETGQEEEGPSEIINTNNIKPIPKVKLNIEYYRSPCHQFVRIGLVEVSISGQKKIVSEPFDACSKGSQIIPLSQYDEENLTALFPRLKFQGSITSFSKSKKRIRDDKYGKTFQLVFSLCDKDGNECYDCLDYAYSNEFKLFCKRKYLKIKQENISYENVVPSLANLCRKIVASNCSRIATMNEEMPKLMCQLFSRDIWFQNHLSDLDFSNCPYLTDSNIELITCLRNLISLKLNGCEMLTNASLFCISQLPQLESLGIRNCKKLANSFTLYTKWNLNTLDLGYCSTKDSLLPFICHITTLTNLDLTCNELTDKGGLELVQLKNLKILDLSLNQNLTDETLHRIGEELTNLTTISLYRCKVTAQGIHFLQSKLPKLIKLDIHERIGIIERRPRILLAEDSKSQQKSIESLLKRFNFDVEIASDGLKALEMFTRNRYDLILMDARMPAMDGFSCIQRIRDFESTQRLNRIPIIVHTADGITYPRSKSFQAGGDEYIPKPFNVESVTIVKDLLNKMKIQD